MPTSLDERFFEKVASKPTNNGATLLESYKCLCPQSTMILYSRKTATPLCALTLMTEDMDCSSMLTARPSLNEPLPFFQGMLNLPDQKFSFVISNLTEESMIRFSILHLPDPTQTVQSGRNPGLEEVNHISAFRENQSYEIRGDKRSGNRRMILSGQKQTKVDPETGENVETEVALTVNAAETAGEGPPVGVYFYLSVQPEKSKAIVDCFAEGTVWKAVPGFVRKVKKPVVIPTSIDEEEEEDCCGPPDFGFSQAGKLSHGSVVYEQSSTCYCEFDYDNGSEPAVLSLSIWEDMKLLELPNIEQQLETETQDWLENERKAWIESLNGVFMSDTCVIDLESEADTIICSCGHQCVNHSNVTTSGLVTCPLCRSPITAFVSAKTGFGYVGGAGVVDHEDSESGDVLSSPWGESDY